VQRPERAGEMQPKKNSLWGVRVYRERECKYIKGFCITDNQMKLFCQCSIRQIISFKVKTTFPVRQGDKQMTACESMDLQMRPAKIAEDDPSLE